MEQAEKNQIVLAALTRRDQQTMKPRRINFSSR